MAVEAELRGLAAWIDESAARVLEVGSTCALGGDPSWDGLLAGLGITPLSTAERQKHITEGPKRTRGASPIEVRWAANTIYERARTALRPLDFKAETPAENALVKQIEQRLYAIVDELTREHLKRVSPPAATTSSIFANARATTPSYGGGVKAGLNQMKCTSCGAPRKTEDPNVGPCVYCGGAMA